MVGVNLGPLKLCYSCKKGISEHWKYCPSCGFRVKKLCEYCSTEVLLGEYRFCVGCGTEVREVNISGEESWEICTHVVEVDKESGNHLLDVKHGNDCNGCLELVETYGPLIHKYRCVSCGEEFHLPYKYPIRMGDV